MSNYYLDTEFIDGSNPELISVGIVSDDDREFYAVSNEFHEERAVPWVQENVLTKLPPRSEWKPRQQIAYELKQYVAEGQGPIQFWGWFCAYDWVLVCGLFGGMLPVPFGWPNLCYDLRTVLNVLGRGDMFLPTKPLNAHNALADAKWHRAIARRMKNQIRDFHTVLGDPCALDKLKEAAGGPLRIPDSNITVGRVLSEVANGVTLPDLARKLEIPEEMVVRVLRDVARGIS